MSDIDGMSQNDILKLLSEQTRALDVWLSGAQPGDGGTERALGTFG